MHAHMLTLFYQPFHTRSSVSLGFRQRNSHIADELVAVAVQVPDLVVHYTIALEVHNHRSRHS